MKMVEMQLDPNYMDSQCWLRYWESETGKYQMYWIRRIFGVAVGFGLKGSGTISRSYCCAGDGDVLKEVTHILLGILERTPEQTTEVDLCRLFPLEEYKPLSNNVILYIHLARLAHGDIELKHYSFKQYDRYQLNTEIPMATALNEYMRATS